MAHVLQKGWADTFHGLGYSDLKDPVDGETIGGSTTNAIDSAKGERSHAGVAFLDPAMKRKNVVIRSGVLVEKDSIRREQAQWEACCNRNALQSERSSSRSNCPRSS
jgi:hypothetical protein